MPVPITLSTAFCHASGTPKNCIACVQDIAMMQYMKAALLAQAKEVRDDGSIVEIVVWELDEPLPPCTHCYKYRLFFGRAGACFVRYDNERGKGDHRHCGDAEAGYAFTTLEALLADFEQDVTLWRSS